MTVEEKRKLLEEERGFYIECETMLRSLIGRPSLTEYEIESHMKACRLFLDEYLEKYQSVYHKDSPFAIKFKENVDGKINERVN